MTGFIKRLGVLPSLLLGLGLCFVGMMAMNYIINSWWPFDVARIDLVRDVSQDRADVTTLLEAANMEIIFTFMAAILITITGISLPLSYLLNKRLGHLLNPNAPQPFSPRFLVVLRQAMWVGFWAVFCVWLQMNRTFGFAVALLVAGVLIVFELLLQIRTRAASVTG